MFSIDWTVVSVLAMAKYDYSLFFFQAEDGIRDLTVTGVQTCALPISLKSLETELAAQTSKPEELTRIARRSFELRQELTFLFESNEKNFVYWYERRNRSEERRVGEEGRSRGSAYH